MLNREEMDDKMIEKFKKYGIYNQYSKLEDNSCTKIFKFK